MIQLTKAIKQLQITLENLAGRSLEYSEQGLFADRGSAALIPQLQQLPENLREEFKARHSSTSNNQTAYAAIVIQATWNITDSLLQLIEKNFSLLSKARLGPGLVNNFNYLDKTKVPKIVDDTTYQIGKALISVLEVASHDSQLLHLLSKEEITNITRILSDNIQLYEVTRPEKIQETRMMLASFHEHIAAQQALTSAYLREIHSENAQQMRLKINQQLETSLTSLLKQPTQVVTHLLAEADKLLEDTERQKTLYREANAQWYINGKEQFPEKMITYDYLDKLINTTTKNQIIAAWETIYQSPLKIINLYERMDDRHDSGKALVSNGTNICVEIHRDIAALNEQKNLRVFFDNLLVQTKHAIIDLTLPEIIQTTDNGFAYQLIRSKADSQLERLTTDQHAYMQLLNQLQQLSQQRQDQKKQIENKYHTIMNDIPDHFRIREDIALIRETMKAYCHPLWQHLSVIETHCSGIESLILRATNEQENIQKDIQLISDEYRKQQLAAVEQRIARTTQQRYFWAEQIRLASITSQTNTDEKTTEHLLNIENQFNERQTFLRKANQALYEFKTVLEENNSIYIPVNALAANKLKVYLECNHATHHMIDSLYNKEKKSHNTVFGIPTNHIKNWLNHHSTIGQSESDAELNELIEIVNDKRTRILAELLINLNDKTIASRKKQDNPAVIDCYQLHFTYQEVFKHHQEKKIARALNHFHHLIADFDNQLAALQVDHLSLKFNLTTCQQLSEKIKSLSLQLVHKEPKQAYQLLQNNQNLFHQLEQLLIHNPYDSCAQSNHALLNKVTERLALEQEKFNTLIILKTEHHNCPQEMLNQANQLLEEYQVLNATVTNLKLEYEQIHQMLHAINHAKKSIFDEQMKEFNKKLNEISFVLNNHNETITLEILEQIETQLQTLIDEERLKNIVQIDSEIPDERINNIQNTILKIKKNLSSTQADLDSTDSGASEISATAFELLHRRYFGTQDIPGIFGEYLQERALTFAYRDFWSSIIAMFLGLFGYKTEASLRKDYIQSLEQTMANYKNDPERRVHINALIHEGFDRFTPRTQEGHPNYNKTLRAKLNAFQIEITPLLTTPAQEQRENIPPDMRAC
ncbi:MAG: hypothetical protein ACOVQX_04855 [Legionella sp.]